MPAATMTQAVIAKFDDSDAADEFTTSGGLWLEMVKEQVSLPFIRFEHSPARFEYTTERDYEEQGSFGFTIFALGVAEVERLALAVMQVFDECITTPHSSFEITDAHVTRWFKTSYRVGVAALRQEDNAVVGQADFEYEYSLHRELPVGA